MCDPIIDPEFAALMPRLSKGEKSILAEKLNEEGMMQPIITWRNIIIDGHNRYEICMAESLPFECREMKFASRLDVKKWMWRNQDGRRNWNESQRAMVAAKMSSPSAENVQPCTLTESHMTQAQAAKEVKVSLRSVIKAKKIMDSGNKDVQAAVEEGKMNVTAAEKIVRLPKPEQKKKMKEIAAESPADPFAHYPEKTREAFTANAEFTKALNTLRSLVGHINAIAGDEKPDSECMAGGFWLRKERQKAISDCRNLKQLLNFSRPYAVCPYCVAKDAKCECCKGAGWVHKSAYQTAPSEYKARVKGMVSE